MKWTKQNNHDQTCLNNCTILEEIIIITIMVLGFELWRKAGQCEADIENRFLRNCLFVK